MAVEKDKKKAKATKPTKAEEVQIDAPKEGVAPRFRERYKSEIIPKLKDEFKYKSAMQVPHLSKIVLNMGLGSKSVVNIKIIDQAVKDMTALCGQKPVVTKSKLAIANFKLRAGLPVGVMVTLRGDRMYEFLDRLVTLALPRIRDFRGISDKGFDGRGNYTLGLKEQGVFPEVTLDTVDAAYGLNLSFITTAKTDAEGRALFTHFGFPWRKRATAQQAA